jgi:hypothetical protein
MKMRTVPVFQIPPSMAVNFVSGLATAWGNLPLALDGVFDTHTSGSAHRFTQLFAQMGAANLPVVPVLEYGATPAYTQAAMAAVNQFAAGLLLRIDAGALQSAPAYAQQIGVNPADIDLLIDVGHVAGISPGLLAPAVANMMNSVNLTEWRSVTLTSSAAPKDASALVAGPNMVPRRDYQLWSTLSAGFPQVHFGDYGISHRDLTEPPGYAMANATVTPRYALPNDWLIRKGSSIRGASGQPMTAQYHNHAQALAAHPNFGAVANCWADTEIQQIAARAGVGPAGGRETWVGYGLNRHISVVDSQLP